jgi:DNA (cytosine-5)-methyltransferase 1
VADTEHQQRERLIPERRVKHGANGSWKAGQLAGRGEALRLDYAQRPRLGERDGQREQQLRQVAEPVAAGHCAWSDFDILHCLDGKARRTQSGLFPLAHGVSGRVAQLRGIGNAIVPQCAYEIFQHITAAPRRTETR